MKILKLSNKVNFSILFVIFYSIFANAEDKPIDIWNIDKKEIEEISSTNKNVITEDTDLKLKENTDSDIFNMQTLKENDSIELEESSVTNEINIYGLYDPEDNDLDINMWSNSNGNQLKNIFSKLNKMELSEDANEIMNIALLTNAYSPGIDISEKTIFDFHLAHQTNPNFTFEPNDNTSKIIWKYLSSLNLLNSFDEIEISEIDKISTIEKAAHNKNYPEKDLLRIYKRFQFNINQLLNAENSYKSLSKIEARALIYQKILLESEMIEKLKLLQLLKNLFANDEIENAFDIELKKFLEKINPQEVPDNLTSFYYTNIEIKKKAEKSIKFNKDVLHQSKLINYFNGNYSKSKIEKDTNNFLKKIKKNKKYYFSKKDQIFLESLKFDGIEISKKYDDLYEVNHSEVPTDIQVMINNNEKGASLLRIVEVIGKDKLNRIDEDTIYFIIRTLNQLDIDLIRNKILLKVLPLKV